MDWVRVECSFFTHRKTIRLRTLIGDNAFWVPLRLWSYAAAAQPDGDFTDYSPSEIALILDYKADAQALLEALQQAGFLDGMKIHDWGHYNWAHAFYHERARNAAQTRWDAMRKKKEKKAKSTSDKIRLDKIRLDKPSNASSIASSTDKAKALSVRSVIDYCLELGLTETDGNYCWNHWESNGWRRGNQPILDWRAAVRSWKAQGYLPSQKTRMQADPNQQRKDSEYDRFMAERARKSA